MTRWEYMILRPTDLDESWDSYMERLNRLGEEGWEAYSSHQGVTHLKRKIAE